MGRVNYPPEPRTPISSEDSFDLTRHLLEIYFLWPIKIVPSQSKSHSIFGMEIPRPKSELIDVAHFALLIHLQMI